MPLKAIVETFHRTAYVANSSMDAVNQAKTEWITRGFYGLGRALSELEYATLIKTPLFAS